MGLRRRFRHYFGRECGRPDEHVLCVTDAWRVLRTRHLRNAHVARRSLLQPTMFRSAIKHIVTSDTMYTYGPVFGLLSLGLILSSLHGTYYAMTYPDAVRSFSSASYIHFHVTAAGLFESVNNLWNISGSIVLLFELAALLLMMLFEFHRGRRCPSPATIFDNNWIIAAIGGSGAYLLVNSQLTHIQANGYHFRYFLIISVCVVFLFVVKTFDIFVARTMGQKATPPAHHRARFVSGTCLALLFSLFAGSQKFGAPAAYCSPSNSIFMKTGLYAAKNGYFAVLGSYWNVWPTVFNAWKVQGHQSIATRVFPTGFRAEVFEPNIRDEAIKRLHRYGFIKLLCVGKNKPAPDLGGISNCRKMAEWNRAWGILPDGQYTETDNGLGEGLADITITLRK